MAEPLALGIIGCGAHVRSQHVPALLALRERVTVVAVADPHPGARADLAQHWPDVVAYADAAALIADPRCRAVLVATPAHATAALARAVAAAGRFLWIEKPIAATCAEAERLASDLAGHPAFVSLNRRFDPAFAALRQWTSGRIVRRVEADMARENRCEPDFVTVTAIHLADVALAVAGPVRITSVSPDDGGRRIIAHGDGVELTLRIRPRSGHNAEFIRVTTADGEAEARAAGFDTGTWTIRDADGVRSGVTDPATPPWARNGTLAETAAFLDACAGLGPFAPSPADFLPVARFCDAVAAAW